MVFDFLTTKDFYDGVKRVSKTSDPFDPNFLWKTEDPNNSLDPGFHPEAVFFYTSAGFLLFPIPVMMVVTITWITYDLTRRLHRICPYLVLLGPLTLVPAALASLTIPLVWLLSPLLHFVQALFVLLAGQPSNWSNDPRNSQGQMGPAFSKFWMFVLILKTVEQLCEALPQVIINSLAFYQRYKLCRRLNFIIRVISIVLSIGSVLLFLVMNVVKFYYCYPDSLLGLLRSRDEEVETIVNENTQEALLPASNSHSTSDNRTDKRKRNIYVQRSSSHPPQAGCGRARSDQQYHRAPTHYNTSSPPDLLLLQKQRKQSLL